jgi:hypothetical protein
MQIEIMEYISQYPCPVHHSPELSVDIYIRCKFHHIQLETSIPVVIFRIGMQREAVSPTSVYSQPGNKKHEFSLFS